MHNETPGLPTTDWHNSTLAIFHFDIVGQLGTAPDPCYCAKISRFQCRLRTVLYLHYDGDNHLTVMDVTISKIHCLRTINFHLYYADQNPIATFAVTFRSYKPQKTTLNISISPPAPLNREQVTKCTDTELWAEAHDRNFDALETKQVIQRTPNKHFLPKTCFMASRWDID